MNLAGQRELLVMVKWDNTDQNIQLLAIYFSDFLRLARAAYGLWLQMKYRRVAYIIRTVWHILRGVDVPACLSDGWLIRTARRLR